MKLLANIRTYFHERRTEKQLKNALGLLYSSRRFDAEELNRALNPKDQIEVIEYYVIIKIAAELKSPYNKNDITLIWEEQIKALEGYVASKEERQIIKELVKLKAHSSMLTFNLHMDILRQAYEFNEYSPGGIRLAMMIAKGRPLTEEEKTEADQHYKRIKETTEIADTKIKELDDLAFKELNHKEMNEKENLILAYRSTKFHVFNPSIVIEISKTNEALNTLLRQNKCNTWAYITAYNPKSITHKDFENTLRHAKLSSKSLNYKCYEGEGVSADPNWKPEKSLLIIGINKEDAIKLGDEFEQNAILFGQIGEAAELVLLKAFSDDSRQLKYHPDITAQLHYAALAKETDEELVQSFNQEVGKPGWVGPRGIYLHELRLEFQRRNWDYSAIMNDSGGFNLAKGNEVYLKDKKLKLIKTQ